jgi:FkbM family methyltransferase
LQIEPQFASHLLAKLSDKESPMSHWKRAASAAARTLGDALNIHIARKGHAWPLLERDLLRQFLMTFEVDCVFDIGANAGQYAALLRSIGYRGAIVSAEPIPLLASHLRAAASRHPRWFVEEIALDEVDSEATFNVTASDQFSSLRLPSNVDTKHFETMTLVVEAITVKTRRLDALFDRYSAMLNFRRPFLKMDTQGNDLAVARGAGERLSCFAGLQSELSIKRLYDGQSDYREAIEFYQSHGFRLSGFVPNNAGHFPDLVEMDCIMYNPNVVNSARLL